MFKKLTAGTADIDFYYSFFTTTQIVQGNYHNNTQSIKKAMSCNILGIVMKICVSLRGEGGG